MSPVQACPLPAGALLARYAAPRAYADCFVAGIDGRVALDVFVEAFYTAWLFRIERWLLALLLSKPSSDADARRVANGEQSAFAAWHVEDRAPDQLLMCDMAGRTRSWFMVVPASGGTRLHFGSAVVPTRSSGRMRMGLVFRLLLGFHRLYSRALLHSARARLMHQHRA